MRALALRRQCLAGPTPLRLCPGDKRLRPRCIRGAPLTAVAVGRSGRAGPEPLGAVDAGGGPPGGHNHSSGHEKVRLDHDWYFHCAAVVEWSDLHAQGARCEQENRPPDGRPVVHRDHGVARANQYGAGRYDFDISDGRRALVYEHDSSERQHYRRPDHRSLRCPPRRLPAGYSDKLSASSFDYDHSPGKDHGAAHKSPAGYTRRAGDHYHPASQTPPHSQVRRRAGVLPPSARRQPRTG